MSTMHDADYGSGARHGVLERLDSPAQVFAATSGLLLAALGVLALVLDDVGFGTVGLPADQPELLVWRVSGWTAVFWIAMGVLGLGSMVRLDTARTYALLAGVVFAVVAVWGFIDGNDVAGILVADATNNVMHAILAGIGLVAGMLPREAQKPQEPISRSDRPAGEGRFESGDRVRPLDRRSAGRH